MISMKFNRSCWNPDFVSGSIVQDRFVAIGLFIVAFVLYGSVLWQYWTVDDPAILATIATHGIWGHFISPQTWAWHQPEPPVWGVFTPWVMFSIGIDWYLGGLDPHLANLHHLLSLGGVMVLLYVVLRRFFSQLAALVACLLYLVTQPIHEAAHVLMERQYIEGLGLFLIAILCYEKALAKDRISKPEWLWVSASAFCYLTACSAKEVYAPLAALLPLLPWGTFRRRLIMLSPHCAAALLYLAWRAYMLAPENPFVYGGVKPQVGLGSWMQFLEQGLILNFQHVPLHWSRWIVIALGILLALALAHATKMTWIRALALLVLSLLPSYSLLHFPQVRLYFLPMLVLMIGYSYLIDWLLEVVGVYQLREKDGGIAISGYWLGAFIVLFGMVAPLVPGTVSPVIFSTRKVFLQFKREGEFMMHAPATNAVVHPAMLQAWFWWYFTPLGYLRSLVLGEKQAPAVCYDPCICSARSPHPGSMRYMKGKLRPTLWPVSRDLDICGDRESPLLVHLELDESRSYPLLKWRLGPYSENGTYELILYETERNVYASFGMVHAEDRFPFAHGHYQVMVRWQSDEGWSTVSPAFTITSGMEPIHWARSFPSSSAAWKNDVTESLNTKIIP